ncbi:unnamed protein product [Prorocentrum cordatum]|uniref:Uncharacterized protein n=1 Tax=Prorocentrum cordatum TaxID=2364126 RepID=A0ABN9Y9E9_9DINO|nr:unnamed protein product [Polarella glacialis]
MRHCVACSCACFGCFLLAVYSWVFSSIGSIHMQVCRLRDVDNVNAELAAWGAVDQLNELIAAEARVFGNCADPELLQDGSDSKPCMVLQKFPYNLTEGFWTAVFEDFRMDPSVVVHTMEARCSAERQWNFVLNATVPRVQVRAGKQSHLRLPPLDPMLHPSLSPASCSLRSLPKVGGRVVRRVPLFGESVADYMCTKTAKCLVDTALFYPSGFRVSLSSTLACANGTAGLVIDPGAVEPAHARLRESGQFSGLEAWLASQGMRYVNGRLPWPLPVGGPLRQLCDGDSLLQVLGGQGVEARAAVEALQWSPAAGLLFLVLGAGALLRGQRAAAAGQTAAHPGYVRL